MHEHITAEMNRISREMPGLDIPTRNSALKIGQANEELLDALVAIGPAFVSGVKLRETFERIGAALGSLADAGDEHAKNLVGTGQKLREMRANLITAVGEDLD